MTGGPGSPAYGSIRADGADLAGFRIGGRVPVTSPGELELVHHELQRVVDALVDGPDKLVIDEEADMLGCPLGAVGMPAGGVKAERHLLHVVVQARIVMGRWRCWPVADPSGPEKVPVWMLETRISPSSGRQAG
jgi:hypothetical protein